MISKDKIKISDLGKFSTEIRINNITVPYKHIY